MERLGKLSVEEIKERVGNRKVLQEIDELYTHLNLRVNGADIHVRSRMERAQLYAYRELIRTEGDKDITFDDFEKRYSEEYDDLISIIHQSVCDFEYKC